MCIQIYRFFVIIKSYLFFCKPSGFISGTLRQQILSADFVLAYLGYVYLLVILFASADSQEKADFLLFCLCILYPSFQSYKLIQLPHSQPKAIMITIILGRKFKGPIKSCLFPAVNVYMIYSSTRDMCSICNNLLESHLF